MKREIKSMVCFAIMGIAIIIFTLISLFITDGTMIMSVDATPPDILIIPVWCLNVVMGVFGFLGVYYLLTVNKDIMEI